MIRRLVSLGSVIVDLVLEVPALPERGGDVLAAQRGMAAGGAFNVLSAAARLGLPGLYAGPHGTGPFGDLVRGGLAREGVGLALPPNPELDTGWTVAIVEPDGERTFVTVTGADGTASAEALTTIRYADGDAVYVSGYDLAYPGAGPAIAVHVAALRPELFVIFDPGPLAGDIPGDRLAAVLGRADAVTLNQRELEVLGGLAAIGGSARSDTVVVVRAGARGATVGTSAGERPSIPALAVQTVVDTSGAGDVHTGATLAGLAQGMSWPEAVRHGNRAAAYAISRRGPAAGPTAEQLHLFGA